MNVHGPHDHEAALQRQSYVRHELRAPLAVIVPLLSLLLEGRAGELAEKQREYLQILQRSVERLQARMESVLDSGWMECAATPAAPVAVPVDQLIDDVLAARRMCAPNEPRIEAQPPSDPPAVVLADREHVRLMLGILLDNATRHTRPQGCICVSATPADDGAGVALMVEDEGDGIPSDVLEALFEFGHGAGAALVEDGQPGLGIGLWVCRELAARNGGTVSVARGASGGTSATIMLPAARGTSTGL